MLIDDDFDDQELFGHALKHLDVSVDFVTANDGIHAIEKLKADPNLNPYFIFVDVDMPRMNGVECIVEIKKISRVKNVPVYLYSTYADPKTIKAGRKSGAVDIVVKAHNMKELEQTLAKILPKK
jgi:CheY-like chemotaxis protein